MGQILLEICCGSAEDALEAAAGSADRVELCSALFLGGLTPSLGSLLQVKQLAKIPVMAMNRPRAAGFCYSETEFAVMERDADLLLEHGADGIVFGILNDDGSVDIQRTRTLRKRIGSRQAVFHRAFDVTPDPFRALDELIDIGTTRVLTSGQKNSAPEAATLIARLIEHARDRIEVLPGAGIDLNNVRNFATSTGCNQIHLTAFTERRDPSTLANPDIKFGSENGPSESTFALTDRVVVRRIKEELLAI
jgi:copper homeostasis protein